MSVVLRGCRHIIKSFKPLQIVENADIVIEGGVIKCMGKCYTDSHYNVLECENSAAIPGLVSLHTHVLPNENGAVGNLEKVLKEVVQHGFIALHVVDVDVDAVDSVCELAKEIGVVISVGPLIEESKDLDKLSMIKLNEGEWCKSAITVDVASIDLETLKKLGKTLKSYEPKPHIQLVMPQDPASILAFFKRYNTWPIIVLDDIGMLTNEISIAHASWLTTWEIERVLSRNACIVLTPFSDSLRGVHGLVHPSIFKLENMGMGLDNVWTRPSTSLALDVIATQVVYSNRTWGFYPDTIQLLNYASSAGARILNLHNMIEVGSEANIAVLSIEDDLDSSITSILIRGLLRKTRYTIVKGSISWSQ
jgi:cytosine/adenosine deaminase-related metal-dependent hydrolase